MWARCGRRTKTPSWSARSSGYGRWRAAWAGKADPRPEAIIARLLERYVQYGQTTLRLVEKTARFRVSCVTRLDRALAERLGLAPVAGVQQVLDRWREEAHGDTVAVVPGPPVYPRPDSA